MTTKLRRSFPLFSLVSLVFVSGIGSTARASVSAVVAATALAPLPIGTWKFSVGYGAVVTDFVLTLEERDGHLTGWLTKGGSIDIAHDLKPVAENSRSSGSMSEPRGLPLEVGQITDASFDNGVLSFSFSRDSSIHANARPHRGPAAAPHGELDKVIHRTAVTTYSATLDGARMKGSIEVTSHDLQSNATKLVRKYLWVAKRVKAEPGR